MKLPDLATFDSIMAVLNSDVGAATKIALMNELRPSLSAVYDKVKSADWKDAIDAVVELTVVEAAMVPYAVEFFTATTPTVTLVGPGTYKVTAAGYRAGPAGDH